MLDREACERRVYRLATLLTGDVQAATRVIAQVLNAQPDLRMMDSAHMDRLTVLRSREIPPRAINHRRAPQAAAEALGDLPVQQREAWVFARVYLLEPREMAKAMDCSVHATMTHLQAADEAMTRWIGSNVNAAARSMLDFSLSLEVPAIYRSAQERRRQIRRATMIAIVVAGAMGLLLFIAWLGRPNPTPDRAPTLNEAVSPLPTPTSMPP